MTDPMAGYDQAEAEAEARTDEARREQHYAEAVQAATAALCDEIIEDRWYPSDAPIYEREMDTVAAVLTRVARWDRTFEGLEAFTADYGTPALLRVIADALEATHASR